ncbi:MAG: Gfo/Idh/MocA family oxidoreductase [Thermoleophilaceae bacterium]|nr:Gfo/Idh/MocA family oxidoreductase [Thermoleophilaceae bacterium]
METPGVGLLGYAFMGRAHAHALITLGHMTGPPPIRPRLVSVAGRDEARRAEFAVRFGFERAVEGWQEVVDDPDVEIVENLLPNNLHAEPVIAAARAGKHVLCEKPLALDAAEARAMLAAAEDAGVVHMCAFNYRFVPAVRRARDMIEAGELGDIHHFRGVYRQSWGADPSREGVWRFDAAQAGGGALGDLATHVIDMSRYLVGDVESVAAEVATFVPGRTVDDAAAAAVRFAGGAVGTIEATRFATGNLNRFTWEVNGSKGSLAFDLERPAELVVGGTRTLVNPDGWWPPGHVLGWEHTFVFELRRFLDAVAGRGSVAPHGATFADGVRASEVADAIVVSAREGRRVSLPA